MGARCQVCDGPVVNGRCKLCGMPYRNEEVLYHLNESRSDHYRHATPKAKKIMKKQEIPAADRNAALGRNSSKEEIKAQQEKVRKDAVERMTAANSGSSRKAANTTTAGSSMNGRNTRNRVNSGTVRNNTKTGKKARLIFLIIFLMIAAAPNVIEDIKERFLEYSVETGTVSGDAEAFYSWEDEYDGVEYLYYSLGRKYRKVSVGTDMEPGLYSISVEEGRAVVDVGNVFSFTGNSVTESSPAYLTLSEGDKVWVAEDSSADRVIFVMILDSGEL